MNAEQLKKVAEQIAELVKGMIADHEDAICADFKRAYQDDASDNGKFAFPLRITAKLRPMGAPMDLEMSLTWGVNTKVTSGITIDDQPDMFKGEGSTN